MACILIALVGALGRSRMLAAVSLVIAIALTRPLFDKLVRGNLHSSLRDDSVNCIVDDTVGGHTRDTWLNKIDTCKLKEDIEAVSAYLYRSLDNGHSAIEYSDSLTERTEQSLANLACASLALHAISAEVDEMPSSVLMIQTRLDRLIDQWMMMEASSDSIAYMIPAGAQRRTTIYFASNDDELSLDATRRVRATLETLRSASTIFVVVKCHCDERGSESYNQLLSERRAKSVRDYLESIGVQTYCIRYEGLGERLPAATGSGEEAWAKNRRCEVIVLQFPWHNRQ